MLEKKGYNQKKNDAFMNNRIFVCIGIIVLLMSSCSSVKQYKSPEIETSGLFRDTTTIDTTSIANLSWKDMFKDPLLQNLIEVGLSNNFDLKIAMSRIKLANASLALSKSAFYPSLSANASVGLSQKIDSVVKTTYQLGLSSSWEFDIWGKLSSAEEANLAQLLQSEAYLRAVKTQLIADIANCYYSLLALDAQLIITQKTLEIRREDVQTMIALKEASMVNEAAVAQNKASMYAVELTIPDIKQSIRTTENALSLLLGRQLGEIRRSDLENQSFPEEIQIGVPAALLSNRPDLQQAEYAFRYAFQMTNVARSYFYPSFTITASATLSDRNINDLFNPAALLGNLVGGLLMPIFNQGTNDARLSSAEATQEQALLSYKKALLTAGQEVSNALFQYQTALNKKNTRENQIESLNKSVEITKELLRYGTSNYIDVLTAEQSLLSAQLSQISDKLQQLQATISLYHSLGGGWK